MGFRISHIHEYDRFIAIDLGSYRVRAALYTMKDGKIELEGSASVRQPRKNIVGGVITDMQGVARTIDKAIHEACQSVDPIPEDIILGFSPTISIHDVIASQYIRDDETLALTMEELDMMIEKIEKSSLERAKEKAKKEYGVIHDDIRLISSTLTAITVDGKLVTHPLGVTGKHVRINVLNIYTLASEYNILRSIISSLKKRTISLVPMPLIFPKFLEKCEKNTYENNIYIDIGYSHVTIVFEKKHEITYFDTFTMGSSMLMDIISAAYPEYSYTEIENLLQKVQIAEEDRAKREELMREYFDYIIDALAACIVRQDESLLHKNIFLSGGILRSEWIKTLFFGILSHNIGYDSKHLHLMDAALEKKHPDEHIITYGLSFLGQELLYSKKDPIIRILRYTLYNYE